MLTIQPSYTRRIIKFVETALSTFHSFSNLIDENKIFFDNTNNNHNNKPTEQLSSLNIYKLYLTEFLPLLLTTFLTIGIVLVFAVFVNLRRRFGSGINFVQENHRLEIQMTAAIRQQPSLNTEAIKNGQKMKTFQVHNLLPII